MDLLRIKNPTLCQIVLYAPAFSCFLLMLLCEPMSELFDGSAWLWLALFIGSACLSLFYLFRHMTLFLATDILFSMIRFWKKDRRWYPAERIGKDRQEAEQRLLGRLRGKMVEPDRQLPCPLAIRLRRSSSLMVHYRGIEQITMIYSIHELDDDGYCQIMASACANLRNITVDEKAFVLLDPKQKKQPVATATAVVILADSVIGTVTDRVRSGGSCPRGYMLPCVVDFAAGQCWYDGMGKVYRLGMTPKPEKNYAQDILQELLFGGALPMKEAGPMLPFPIKGCSPDMTLMELLKQYDDVLDTDFLAFLKLREKWITRKMKNGDVLLHQGMLYCKLHKKVAEVMIQTDLNNHRNIRITLPERWCLPKQNKTSKDDRKRICEQAEGWLIKQGYRVFVVPEKEEP